MEFDEMRDFQFDLYSHIKACETNTHRSVYSVLQSVFQSAPEVWSIDLSKRKASVLLEVLKLQTQKKPVKLRGWSDEESEVRSFLQCLPYISQLRFTKSYVSKSQEEVFHVLVNLSVAAAEHDAATGESFSELLSSVCSYSTFPVESPSHSTDTINHSDFLLDLYSHIKGCETNTHRSVYSVLQSVFQSAPEVWYIDLSERKASLLLEVLKLQTQKKPVELRGWSEEESEVRSFLQCLPYISQLRIDYYDELQEVVQVLVNLSVAAAERDAATGERFSELLSSVCSYSTFPFEDDMECDEKTDFQLDLYSHIKACETNTHRSVYSVLQFVFQSAPEVWSIDLSKRKASVLLEVLKLQTQKRPVELWGWSDGESEVRSFLQCLPYISQLRCVKM
ncbi:uncharacterized protein LOC143127236 [Alosa pseudoharengus]|uniref:uncharacterized protein LOC143127236 n=1 Tax=Alosa pseudoharengus TaxID=34774 RepID=UPI003F88B664